MKSLTLELPEEIYERAERRAAARGTTLREHATQVLSTFANCEDGDAAAALADQHPLSLSDSMPPGGTPPRVDPDEQILISARARMRELFASVTGFQIGAKIPREELHERGSLR